MKKKWILWTAGILSSLVVLALVAPLFIPWGKVKDKAVAYASKALGRELKVGVVEASLFTGVHARDISLANAPGPGFSALPLFSVKDAKINLSFLSLLSGKVVINSITFIQPQILLETNAEGVSGLQGLGSGSSKQASTAKGGTDPGPSPVVIGALVIQDGDIQVKDKKKGTATALHGLQAKIYGLHLAGGASAQIEVSMVYEAQGKKLPIELKANLNPDLKAKDLDLKSLTLKLPGLLLKADGKIKNWSEPNLDLNIDLVVQLAEAAKLAAKPMNLGGSVQVKARVQGRAKELASLNVKGTLGLDDVSYEDESNPSVSGLKGSLNFDSTSAQGEGLAFKLAGENATLGLKADWRSGVDLDLDYQAEGVKGILQAASAADPDSNTLKQMQGKVEGRLSLKAQVKGIAKKAYRSAEAQIELKDGMLRPMDLQEKLAKAIPHPETQALLRKDIKFTQMVALVSATPARITLKSLELGSGADGRGGDIYVQANGYKEPGRSVDFKITPRFNPNAVKIGGEVGEAFQDDKGWATYDYLAYYGPSMDKAKADFGPGLKKAMQKAANKQIEKLKGQAKEQVKQKAEELIKEKAPDLLKQLPNLKGVFGQ